MKCEYSTNESRRYGKVFDIEYRTIFYSRDINLCVTRGILIVKRRLRR